MTLSWSQWEGQVIAGAFPLQRHLGGDGDHAVFLTECSDRQPRQAAIKIVLGDPDALVAQLRRWSAAAQLSHRNLIQIFTLGQSQSGGTPLVYLVMEHADENLAQVLPDRPLTVDEARQMLQPALSALSYVHGQGFVHGHLSPGRIMAVGDCLKIASAELCRAGECPSASAGAHRPPEGRMSPAGDVWSLGMILVEALTQRLPAQTAGGVDRLVPDTLPHPFLEIARRSLRNDPQSRATARELAALLEPGKRPALRWRDAVGALIGLAVAAIVITPRFLNRQAPVPNQQAAHAQAPASAPATPATSTPPPATPATTAPDEIIQRTMPKVPAQSSRTIQGKVRVNVLVRVNSSGKVADASLESPGPSRYFAQLALQAARRWKFAPAPDSSGREREWILRFEFLRQGTSVEPVRRGF